MVGLIFNESAINSQPMSQTREHAERELKLLLEYSTTKDRPVVEEFIPEILALCEKFGNSGQSSGSAPFVAAAITDTLGKLLMREPLLPLIGDESEWMLVAYPGSSDAEVGKPMYQNLRNASVFKVGEEGMPYFLDAIIWRGPEEHDTFNGKAATQDGKIYSSHQYFRMPFAPKTIYVDVLEMGEGFPADYLIRFPQQLDEVWKYYIKPD